MAIIPVRRLLQISMSVIVVGGLAAAPVHAASPTDLFISEYVDGSNPAASAIEIFNGTASAVDLAAGSYSLMIYANGAAQPTVTINLTGTIASADVRVLANGQAPPNLAVFADQLVGTLSFDGNDAVALRKNGALIDRIGQIGFDPGAGGWGIDPVNTANNTLRRKASVTAGDTGSAAFDPAVGWDGYAVDTFDGLGSHTISTGGGSGSSSGTVDATVDVAAAAACIELSTTSISFGTLPLGAEDESASPNVVVTNCATSSETLLASGTDATSLGVAWQLVGGTATCSTNLGTDNYRLGLFSMNMGDTVGLTESNSTVEELAGGQSAIHNARIYTACPGSSGGGTTLTMHINYLATQ